MVGRWIGNLRAKVKAKGLDQVLTGEQQQQLAKLGMIWDRNSEKWELYFKAAEAYYKTHGNLDVATKYVTEDGIPLGRWIANISSQVHGENTTRSPLTDEQLQRLAGIGFSLEKKSARQWNEKYELAKTYYETHGDLNVPVSYCVNGIRLGRWISNIRTKRKNPGASGMVLDEIRIQRLDSIGMNWK